MLIRTPRRVRSIIKNSYQNVTRIDVYETLCPQQMLVHKGGKIKNWGGECRDVTPTNCSHKIYLKRALGGGGGGGGVGLEGSGWM